jgi:uncharacterized protein (DUF1800 family)
LLTCVTHGRIDGQPARTTLGGRGAKAPLGQRLLHIVTGVNMKTNGKSSRRAFLGGVGAASVAALSSTAAPAQAPKQPGSGSGNRPAVAAKAGSDSSILPPLSVRALHRMGYGPARREIRATSAPVPNRIFAGSFETSNEIGLDDIAYFNSLGPDDDTRLAAYVEQQIYPHTIPDPVPQQRIAQYAPAFAVMNETLGTVWSNFECEGFDEYARPYFEVEKAAFVRAIFSRRQLFEVMVDFWHNHFNIFAEADEDTLVSWHSWDRDVIRAYAHGNFYNMLEASAKHPAMLEYLDNYENSRAGFNENYARELFELHTLGAENYRGLQLPFDVEALATNPYAGLGDPDLDNATAAGGLAISNPTRQIARYYVDNDVYEAARALTGWRYNDQNVNGVTCGSGAFFTIQDEHDVAAKSVLGRGFVTHKSDLTAEPEGRTVLKMAAYHPGTATYIARKLCQRLIADDPPESVVQAAAATFFEHRLSGDQIARTLRTILNSAEFKDPALWGSKTKRPFEYIVSAMRAAGGDYTFREDDSTGTTDEFLYYFNGAGQRLFYWRTPDGYPDKRSHWQGTNGLVQVWRTLDWLIDRNANNDTTRVMRIIDYTLRRFTGDPTAREVVEFWCDWILGFTPAGGWTGAPGTLISNAPTTVGKAALQFFTQSGYGSPGDRNIWPADEERIPRLDLRNNAFPYDWNSRLRGLVNTILSSPNFMLR